MLTTGPGGNRLRSSDLFKIHIEHLPTKNEVSFEGFVTGFSDTYTSQWNEEMVYGRMDPLSTFQSTRRSIEIGFDIPNDSKQHAIWNMSQVRQFIQFLYPTYNDSGLSQQNVLKAGPLLGIKWINLISSPNNAQEKLIGYINGSVSYSPEMNDGGFLARRLSAGLQPAEDSRSKEIANYFPKKLSLSFNFTVLHTHLVGWAPDAESAAAGVTSFVFGGDQAIASAFPNAAISPPPAPPTAAAESGEKTTDDANEDLTDGEEAAASEEDQEATTEQNEEALNNTELTAGEKCAALGGMMAVRGDPGGAVESYCNVPPAPGEDPKDGPCEGDRVRRYGPGTACRSPE